MNITASAAFRYILLKTFCIIFITHVYKSNILRPHGKQQQESTRRNFDGFFCYKDIVVKAIFRLNYYSNCSDINVYINLCI